jgi:hypothetical protein
MRTAGRRWDWGLPETEIIDTAGLRYYSLVMAERDMKVSVSGNTDDTWAG